MTTTTDTTRNGARPLGREAIVSAEHKAFPGFSVLQVTLTTDSHVDIDSGWGGQVRITLFNPTQTDLERLRDVVSEAISKCGTGEIDG